jgi:hypothetical protein
LLLQNADCCHSCLNKHYIIDHPDNSENFGGGQYFKMDGTSKDWDFPATLDVDYRCFDLDMDVDLVRLCLIHIPFRLA